MCLLRRRTHSAAGAVQSTMLEPSSNVLEFTAAGGTETVTCDLVVRQGGTEISRTAVTPSVTVDGSTFTCSAITHGAKAVAPSRGKIYGLNTIEASMTLTYQGYSAVVALRQEPNTQVDEYRDSYGSVSYGVTTIPRQPATYRNPVISVTTTLTRTYASGEWETVTETPAYTVLGWSVPSPHSVDSDGNLTVTANTGSATRSIRVTARVQLTQWDRQLNLYADLTQEYGVISYGNIEILTFSYPDAAASGQIVTPTVTYRQPWGYDGQTSGGGYITTGATLTYSGTNVSASGFVTVPAKPAEASGRTTYTTSTVTVALNGKTANLAVAVKQAANAVEETDYWMDITGGQATTPDTGGDVTLRLRAEDTYTSGATAYRILTTGVTWSATGTGLTSIGGGVFRWAANAGAQRTGYAKATYDGTTYSQLLTQAKHETGDFNLMFDNRTTERITVRYCRPGETSENATSIPGGMNFEFECNGTQNVRLTWSSGDTYYWYEDNLRAITSPASFTPSELHAHDNMLSIEY